MTELERFPIPRRYGDEALAAAILDRLRPLAESPVTRAVRVAYWRDGDDRPLDVTVYTSQSLHRVLPNAPVQATFLTIEEAAAGTHQAVINKHLVALGESIDAALAALQPGQRLCLHLPNLGSRSADLHVDLHTMRIRQDYHYLAADQTCDVPNRTEYRQMSPRPQFGTASEHSIEDPFTGDITVTARLDR